MSTKEEWRDIPSYEGLYQVSNLGRVKSLNYRRTGKERILKTYSINGYFSISLKKNNSKKSFLVHRLVAMVFIPNPDNKPFVDHINTIRTDNRVENLRWVSQKENMKNKETKRKLSKVICQYTLDGKLIKKWKSMSEASKELNISRRLIGMVCNRNCYSGYGYIWRFEGDTVSESDINRLKQGNKRPVLQYSKDGTFIRKWDSIAEACNSLGIKGHSLSDCCNGKLKTSNGYIWKYACEEIEHIKKTKAKYEPIDIIDGEEWRDTPNWEGLYQVSNLGRVKRKQYGKEILFKQTNTKNGYKIVHLNKKGERKTIRVHRLVAETFPDICGEWFENCVIDHINTDRSDNRAINLRICSQYDNMKNESTREKLSKKIIQLSLSGEKIKEWKSLYEITSNLHIWSNAVSDCCKGIRSTFNGFIWRFKEEYDYRELIRLGMDNKKGVA